MRSPAHGVALVLTLFPLLCPTPAFAQAPGALSVGPGVSPAGATGPPGPPAPAGDRSSPQTEAPAAQPAIVPVTIGGLWYLSAQHSTTDVSRFTIKRGYINIETKVLPFMSARITPDVTQDASGDLKVRLKYAYAKFTTPDLGFITHPEIEVGVAHMPWLDFEEHVNLFRLQDTMFMERNGLFNSADIGVTFMALLGGPVAKAYQDTVSKAYPGRYGSFAVGVYNGGGYHAAEQNDDKAIEGRLTLRVLPALAPGLQVSYFGVRARGNPGLSYRILVTMFDRRNRVHHTVLKQIRGAFGDAVLRTVIEIDTKLRECPIFGQPVTMYASSSRAAEQYRALARELRRYARQKAAQAA